MGYSHYWLRKEEIPVGTFSHIVEDFSKLLPVLEEKGVVLAGSSGDGRPVINEDCISFNGLAQCGHKKQPFSASYAWPLDDAGGVFSAPSGSVLNDPAGGVLNDSAGGVLNNPAGGVLSVEGIVFFETSLTIKIPFLRTRMCDGDCSHESFVFPRILDVLPWEVPKMNQMWLRGCKTCFKPYDLAVTACLLIAKKHLGSELIIKSDGNDNHWFDAKLLCSTILGYGLEFCISRRGVLMKKGAV